MTQNQVIFGRGKKSRKVKQIAEEYECGHMYRRAVLLSCDDVDRMAVESSRARLISHLVSKSEDHYPREFASYYRGPTRYIDPPYSITSHTNGVPIPRIPHVIPAYPSLIQTPRWCPYKGPISDSEITMDQNYNCRCINCTSQNCPAKYSSSTLKPSKFKDNIMTFCDRYTMTRKVIDASCGRTPIASTLKCSDVIVPSTSSMVAVRDGQGKHKIQEMYSHKDQPVPILKKACPGSVYYDCYNKKLIEDDFQDEAVRDIDPAKTKSIKCFFRKEENAVTDLDGMIIARKNIYNEGISDKVTTKFALSSMRPCSPPECSGSSVASKYYDSEEDNYIPHSHASESKYHTDCVKPKPREFHMDDGTERMRHTLVVPGPRVICKPFLNKPCRRCKPPRIIRLPKKVLTSERVIDSCVEKHPKNRNMICKRK